MTANGSPKSITLTPDGRESTLLSVQDDTAETISLTVTDSTNASIPPCTLNVTYTDTSHVAITPLGDSYDVPVPTTDAGKPNWLNFKVSPMDKNQLVTTFLGVATLTLRHGAGLPSDQIGLFTVQQRQSDGITWTTLQPDPMSGQFTLHLDNGELTLRAFVRRRQRVVPGEDQIRVLLRCERV